MCSTFVLLSSLTEKIESELVKIVCEIIFYYLRFESFGEKNYLQESFFLPRIQPKSFRKGNVKIALWCVIMIRFDSWYFPEKCLRLKNKIRARRFLPKSIFLFVRTLIKNFGIMRKFVCSYQYFPNLRYSFPLVSSYQAHDRQTRKENRRAEKRKNIREGKVYLWSWTSQKPIMRVFPDEIYAFKEKKILWKYW